MSTLTIERPSIRKAPMVNASRMLTGLRERISQEPSIIPITLGTSSIGGAFLTSLYRSTRSLAPWLGVIGTICVALGIHCTGSNKRENNVLVSTAEQENS